MDGEKAGRENSDSDLDAAVDPVVLPEEHRLVGAAGCQLRRQRPVPPRPRRLVALEPAAARARVVDDGGATAAAALEVVGGEVGASHVVDGAEAARAALQRVLDEPAQLPGEDVVEHPRRPQAAPVPPRRRGRGAFGPHAGALGGGELIQAADGGAVDVEGLGRHMLDKVASDKDGGCIDVCIRHFDETARAGKARLKLGGAEIFC